MKRVDLNVDIGEGFSHDEGLLQVATSANVCCGTHAGSGALTTATVGRCRELGVRLGAHPGYPDRESMGRRSPSAEEAEAWCKSILRQVERFQMVDRCDYVKPHGAFYNDSMLPGRARDCLVELLRSTGLPLLGLDRTEHPSAAAEAGVPFIREGFADRAYRPDGRLVPRGQKGAVLESFAAVRSQVLALAPAVDSLCLHGDTESCVEFARLIRTTLMDAGYEVGV